MVETRVNMQLSYRVLKEIDSIIPKKKKENVRTFLVNHLVNAAEISN